MTLKKILRRNDLINKINYDLENKLGLEKNQFKLAGILILFNNLLQSLFKSQILTLGLVMIGIFAMFLVLFRNIKLSLIGVVPNFIAAFFILGIIGMLGIPLDMMTITIAAITIGIAVDNSIHYIYRFKEEFNNSKIMNKLLKFVIQLLVAHLKYFYYNSFWFFNFSFIKIYSYYLFWLIYRSSNVIGNDFCFNFTSFININDQTIWKIIKCQMC